MVALALFSKPCLDCDAKPVGSAVFVQRTPGVWAQGILEKVTDSDPRRAVVRIDDRTFPVLYREVKHSRP